MRSEIHRKSIPENMENHSKSVPKRSPKLSINSSEIHYKTGNEEREENHQDSCFRKRPDRAKYRKGHRFRGFRQVGV